MILAWAGLVVVVVIAVTAIPTGRMISAAAWPTETPLSLHDNRARDPHLRHLARILESDATLEAQRTVATLAEGMVTSSEITLHGGEQAARARLAPVRRFAAEPPARDHARFLRQLAAALEEIERL